VIRLDQDQFESGKEIALAPDEIVVPITVNAPTPAVVIFRLISSKDVGNCQNDFQLDAITSYRGFDISITSVLPDSAQACSIIGFSGNEYAVGDKKYDSDEKPLTYWQIGINDDGFMTHANTSVISFEDIDGQFKKGMRVLGGYFVRQEAVIDGILVAKTT
jgi:hypothetical protein